METVRDFAFKYKLKAVGFAGLRTTLRKSGPFLALSAAFAAPPAAPAPDALQTLRSGSYSVETAPRARATILDWNIDRGKDLGDIEGQFRQLNPDLCIFQEVDLNARRSGGIDVAKKLAEEFRMNYVFAPEFEELSQGTPESPAYHGQALLTKLPIRSSRMLRFVNQSGFWKPRRLLKSSMPLWQRREGGRIALITELDNGGKPLVVYNLHLESRGKDQLRLAQLEEVLADAKQYPAETSVIIAGDLNTKTAHSALMPRLRQAGYRSAFGDRRIRTHLFIGALDWVFVRGPIECEHADVLRGVDGSDHFPITVDVRLESGPTAAPSPKPGS
jgi:endonuclease/exonuclease/phosphatase family metal-dependent hydrolase